MQGFKGQIALLSGNNAIMTSIGQLSYFADVRFSIETRMIYRGYTYDHIYLDDLFV